VDLPDIKPCCSSTIIFLNSGLIILGTILSNIFGIIEIIEIGR